ncbi:hypothetical protein Tco_0976376 [Tanacetum coccineum]|uniref:Retrovirus-related Pol polyprotein from transposon TNT 1-94-like beta-barrel domain-containing protein n=1 Tax=Tanacetum coccineum TaxID=301880 RepID=A0ABQ5EH82_9ASTR
MSRGDQFKDHLCYRTMDFAFGKPALRLMLDDEKKKLGKYNEAKTTLYNSISLKDCKIDLPTQQYKKFLILSEETIDSGFTRFNAIVTSLKSLDQDHSSKNHVRKFLRALPDEGHFIVQCLKPKEKKDLVEELRVIVKNDDEPQKDATCLIAIDSLEIVDSGCTKHMTENRRLFTKYKESDGVRVAFRSNLKGKVIGGGNISHDSITITNVEHVTGLTFNLISIVLNKETIRNGESLTITFYEIFLEPKSSPSVEDDRINEPIVQDLNGSPSLQVNVSDEGYPKSVKEARDHPIEQVIGEFNERTLRAYVLRARTYVKGMEVRQHCCFNEMKDKC